MNISFFPKIAFTGIRNNKRLYYPYFLTCICVVSIFYILEYITHDASMAQLSYVDNLQQLTYLGCFVLILFSVIFLLYTNSFLIKRRRKEFGLYNVLGMSKKNIALVLFFETIFILAVALVLGIGTGILFSKLAQLLLLNIVKLDLIYEFTISTTAISNCLLLYIPVFILIYIINIINITNSKAVELVKAEQEGEKQPKANWLLGTAGIVILGFAYYLALNVDNALGAVTIFFFAVLMVIVATYLIFIASSVLICKILKKNKNYYYKTNHFVSISSMEFRMKRNGAGLATICILLTMVLVMVSTTSCLYYGINDVIDARYPYEYQISYRYYSADVLNDDEINYNNNLIETTAKNNGLSIKDIINYEIVDIGGYVKDDVLHYNEYERESTISAINGILTVNFIPLRDYNNLTGQNITLKDNQVLMYQYNKKHFDKELILNDDFRYEIVSPQQLNITDEFKTGLDISDGITDVVCVIVSDFESFKNRAIPLMDRGYITDNYKYNFNIEEDIDKEAKAAYKNVLSDALLQRQAYDQCTLQCRALKIDDAYGLYGGLFFLGITLSLVFSFATILIIYYKQISEGYEDEPRFEIMKKVGITDTDIRKTINTQMLLVFFLPLTMAIIHLCVAFPMIRHLLALLNFTSLMPFIKATIISIALCAVAYTIVFKITSNSYYKIVNNELE